jgi:hypothetical protein
MTDLNKRLDYFAEVLIETTHLSQYAGLVYEASAEIAALKSKAEPVAWINSETLAEIRTKGLMYNITLRRGKTYESDAPLYAAPPVVARDISLKGLHATIDFQAAVAAQKEEQTP